MLDFVAIDGACLYGHSVGLRCLGQLGVAKLFFAFVFTFLFRRISFIQFMIVYFPLSNVRVTVSVVDRTLLRRRHEDRLWHSDQRQHYRLRVHSHIQSKVRRVHRNCERGNEHWCVRACVRASKGRKWCARVKGRKWWCVRVKGRKWWVRAWRVVNFMHCITLRGSFEN